MDFHDSLMSRRQIGEVLQRRFFVTQKIESLRMLFGRLDITRLSMGTDPESGRGQVGYFDPMVTWVMAVYFHWPRLASTSPIDAMRSCMSQATSMRAGVADDQTRRLAYYLFISDVRWGLDTRVLDAALMADPSLLDLTLDARETLTQVLRLYKQTVMRNSLGHDIGHIPLGHELRPDSGDEAADGQLIAQSWPFYGIDGHEFLAIMQDAGLYDPASDPDAMVDSLQ